MSKPNYNLTWWDLKPHDPVSVKVTAEPFWQELREEVRRMIDATYLGIEEYDIPDDKVEAYRYGFIVGLHQAGRIFYGMYKVSQAGTPTTLQEARSSGRCKDRDRKGDS